MDSRNAPSWPWATGAHRAQPSTLHPLVSSLASSQKKELKKELCTLLTYPATSTSPKERASNDNKVHPYAKPSATAAQAFGWLGWGASRTVRAADDARSQQTQATRLNVVRGSGVKANHPPPPSSPHLPRSKLLQLSAGSFLVLSWCYPRLRSICGFWAGQLSSLVQPDFTALRLHSGAARWRRDVSPVCRLLRRPCRPLRRLRTSRRFVRFHRSGRTGACTRRVQCGQHPSLQRKCRRCPASCVPGGFAAGRSVGIAADRDR